VTITPQGASATSAQMQALIDALFYDNTSDNPDETNRTVTFTLSDDDDNGSGAPKTVSAVTTVEMSGANVDEAPMLDLDADDSKGSPPDSLDITVGFREGDPQPVLLSDVIGISDDNDELKQLVLDVSGIDVGQENLEEIIIFGQTFKLGTAVVVGDDIRVSAGAGQPEFRVTVTPGAAGSGQAMVTIAAVAVFLDVNAFRDLIESIQYNNISQGPTENDRTVIFRLGDAGGKDAADATATINVAAVDDGPPIAVDDPDSITQMVASEGSSLIIDVLANDTLPDGRDDIVVTIVTGPASGSVTVNADKTITYTSSNDGFTGDVTIVYRITELVSGQTDTATVTIGVFNEIGTIGDDFNNTLTGTLGADFMDGRGGNDLLDGLAGNDKIFGGTGDDTILGGAGADYMDGGAGHDIVDYSAATSRVAVDIFLPGWAGAAGDGLGDEFVQGSVEEVIGTDFNDDFRVAFTPLIVRAGLGNDTVVTRSGGGHEILGEGGDDFFLPKDSDFNDTIAANTSGLLTRFDGGDGRDFLEGGGRLNLDTTIVHGTLLPSGAEQFANIEDIRVGHANDLVDMRGFTTAFKILIAEIGNVDLQIWGQGGSDTIFGSSQNDAIQGDWGDDSIEGGAGRDLLSGDGRFGTALNPPTVNGEGDGNDTLRGGDGDDRINIGGGDDQAFGDDGNDAFMFMNALGFIDEGTGFDRIDGGNGFDFITPELNLEPSGGVGAVALNLVLDDMTGPTSAEGLNSIEQVVGGSNNDTIDTSNFIYTFAGSSDGRQVFDGVRLDIRVEGAAGNDTLVGSDTVALNDHLRGGAGSDFLSGGAGEDRLDEGFGVGPGDDTLRGGDDDDWMVFAGTAGFSGSDVVDGGDGVDTATANTVGYNWDLGRVGMTYISVERALGSTADDVITAAGYSYVDPNDPTGQDRFSTFGALRDIKIEGLEGDDTLTGSDGNDWLLGDVGNDSLRGGLGNDVLYSGTGDDTLRGGEGIDVLAFASSAGDSFFDTNDVVEGSNGVDFVAPDNLNVMSNYALTDANLISIERVIGSNLSDNITAAGYAYTQGGFNDNRATTGYTGSAKLEVRINGRTGDDSITGSGFGDWLLGEDGNDTLRGGNGNDVLAAGAGDDDLNGQNGDDFLLFASLDPFGPGDVISGGNGVDTIAPDDLNVAVNYAIDRSNPGVTTPFLASIEAAWGSDRDDVITAANWDYLTFGADDRLSSFGITFEIQIDGRSGNDFITGSAENDWLIGGGGNDTLRGGTGGDLLVAAAGAVVLDGEDDNDLIAFTAGNAFGVGDIVDGGDGVDILTPEKFGTAVTYSLANNSPGVGTPDILSIERAWGSNQDDVIDAINYVYVDPDDPLGSDRLTAGRETIETINIQIDGRSGDDSITGSDLNDELIGGLGDDTLIGGAGNDVFRPGNGTGNDFIDGGAGNDQFLANQVSAGDVLIGGTGVDTLMGTDITQQVIYTDQAGGGVFDNIERFLGGNQDDVITLRDYLCTNCEVGVPTIPTVFIDGGAGDDLLSGISVGFSNPGNANLDPDNDDDWIIGGTGADTINPGSGPNTVYFGTVLGDGITAVADGDTDILVYLRDSVADFLQGTSVPTAGRADIVRGMDAGAIIDDVIDLRDILDKSPFYLREDASGTPITLWDDVSDFFWLTSGPGGSINIIHDSDGGQTNINPGLFLTIENAPEAWANLDAMVMAGNLYVDPAMVIP
jgi:Ca2+-binding RTX toxin-like protein